MIRVVRSEEEIDELLDRAYERADIKSKFWGASFEEGVKRTLLWLTEEEECDPLET